MRVWERALVALCAIGTGLAHSCALHASGLVTCWGSNSSGAIGGGVMGGIPLAPTPVVGLTNASQLALGYSGSCALRTTATWSVGETARR